MMSRLEKPEEDGSNGRWSLNRLDEPESLRAAQRASEAKAEEKARFFSDRIIDSEDHWVLNALRVVVVLASTWFFWRCPWGLGFWRCGSFGGRGHGCGAELRAEIDWGSLDGMLA
jgi:hypothetical protein